MIDFLELRIPANAPHGPLLARPGVKPPAKVFGGINEWVQDLTAHVPVKVCWDNPFNHTHKLLFVGVANLDAHLIMTIIRDIFDVEPLDLEITRVDFAVDLQIPMRWFAEHMTVVHKRRLKGYGCGTPYNRWEGTTLYFGNRPSMIRVYDKVAQLKSLKLTSPYDILTRIEHQVDSKALKSMDLHTLRDLLNLVPRLDPFTSIRLPAQATLTTQTKHPPLKTILASKGLQNEFKTASRAQLEKRFKDMGYNNVGRDLDKLMPFTETEVIQVPNLSALFSASVTKQLFGYAEDQLAA